MGRGNETRKTVPYGKFIQHKIIQLNPKVPSKTITCSTALSFAVTEEEIPKLIEFAVDFVKRNPIPKEPRLRCSRTENTQGPGGFRMERQVRAIHTGRRDQSRFGKRSPDNIGDGNERNNRCRCGHRLFRHGSAFRGSARRFRVISCPYPES